MTLRNRCAKIVHFIVLQSLISVDDSAVGEGQSAGSFNDDGDEALSDTSADDVSSSQVGSLLDGDFDVRDNGANTIGRVVQVQFNVL